MQQQPYQYSRALRENSGAVVQRDNAAGAFEGWSLKDVCGPGCENFGQHKRVLAPFDCRVSQASQDAPS